MKDEFISMPTYTWKDEYMLPYESRWARILKFCVLNGISWTNFKKNRNIKKLIKSKGPTPRLDGLQHEVMERNYTTYRICPECIKYGYHSVIHQIPELHTCFLHTKTVLQSIESEKLFHTGIYEFIGVRIEDVVNNSIFRRSLDEYLNKRAEKAPIHMNVLFPKYKRGNDERIIYYNSTKKALQKLYFLQEDVEILGCKRIFSINAECINNTNRSIAEDITRAFSRDTWKYNDLYDSNTKSYEDILENCRNFIMRKNSDIPNLLKEDVLGCCFMCIMSDIIENIFNGRYEWERVIMAILNDKPPLEEQSLYKVSLAMTCLAITNALSHSSCFNTDSRYWECGVYKCNYGLDVATELNNFHNSFIWNSKTFLRVASQFVVYPLVKDIFFYVAHDLYQRFINEQLSLNIKFLNTCDNSIINVPQYVVLYYKDKIEIHRCQPELGDNSKIER